MVEPALVFLGEVGQRHVETGRQAGRAAGVPAPVQPADPDRVPRRRSRVRARRLPPAPARPEGDRGGSGFLTVLLAEPLHAASGVNELLLARVEGVAVGANVGVDLGDRGSRLERIPTRARHRRRGVGGMNVFLHGCLEQMV